ncbi:Hypothetical predicted protein [Pelobates cultripes]|uniref:Uncharacterized protein n=1 Tax=Pelobates cultripes TaxID=61616 RepID=A0AAD1WEG2_PELCU|nr:Hypothetical predicted protein [Pelobates cultripes]
MPFFLPPGTKHKRWPHYASLVACQKNVANAFAAWWDPDWLTPEAQQTQSQDSDEMEKKSQRSQVQTPREAQDIGTLLQRTPKHRGLEGAETEAYDPQEEEGGTRKP